MRVASIMLLWICLETAGCQTGRIESTCADPIDERHRGLQWLSSGPLGQHLAVDFVVRKGAPVRAIADGHIERNYASMGTYGGCDGTPGPVLVTRHSGGTQGSFAIQYGHVSSDLKDGTQISAGEVIGTVADYAPCCDSPKSCPHLHFAVWDAPTDCTDSPCPPGMTCTPTRYVGPDWDHTMTCSWPYDPPE